MLSSSSARRLFGLGVCVVTASAVAVGPLAASAGAAPMRKPIRITDLSLTATVPDGAGGTTALASGGATQQTSISFAFASAVTGVHFSCRLDGAKAKACTSPTTVSNVADGTHAYRVTAAAAGHRSQSKTFTWSVDHTAPPAVTFNPFSTPSKTSPAITFTPGESGDTFTCAIDNAAPVACSAGSTGTSAATGEGPHTLTVVPTDAAGNPGPAAATTWTIDLTPPDVTIQDQPADPNNASAQSIHFAVLGADATTHAVQCRVTRNGSTVQALADCTSPYAVTTGTDGDYVVHVIGTDFAGNQDDATVSWTRDATAPAAPIVATGPDALTKQTHVTFTWGDVAGATSYECAVDSTVDADFASCVSGVQEDVTAETSHTFYVRALDAVNTSAPTGYTWVVDTTPPVIDVSGLPAASTNATAVAPVVEVTDTHALAADCDLAGPTPSSTCGPYAGLADGAYTLTVNATDGAGNAADPFVATWTVDTTAPTAVVHKPRSLTRPVRIVFSEPVKGLVKGAARLSRANGGAVVPTTRRCFTGTALVSCTSTLRAVTLTPKAPLVPGQHYVAGLLAGGATDAAANPVATTVLAFRGQRSLSETTPAAHYRWASVRSVGAVGGRYVREHLAGAKASFAFRGGKVTWWTRTGPTQGRAVVRVDGKVKARVNNYAKAIHQRVPRRLAHLGKGKHVVSVVVLGTKGAKHAKGTFVAVDAFSVGTHRTANPALAYRWATAKHAVRTDLRGAQVSLRFRGTAIAWKTLVGPREGIAKVYLDGKLVKTVDNHAAAAKARTRTLAALTDALHTIRVVVSGKHRAGGKASDIVVDGFHVS